MGTSYQLLCEECGYDTMVSGGDDAGMLGSTTTVLCENCRELYDVVKFMVPRTPADEFGPVEPRCPRSKRHTVRKWKYPGPCPKCGHRLTEGGLMSTWD